MTLLPRDVLALGKKALGTWMKIAAAEPIEIIAHAGFDFVVIDLEHAPISLDTAYRIINSATANGVCPFVRVPNHDPSVIQKVLDAGAHGLFVPRVDTIEQATAVAQAFSFPPAGFRGAGGTSKAGLWGLRANDDYLDFGRTQALLIVQLEAESAIDDAEKIAALDAVAGIFVGAADLSMSLGTTPGSAQVQAMIDRAQDAAHTAGKLFGLAYGASPAAVQAGFERSIDFAVSGNDSGLLAAAAVKLVNDINP